MQKITISLDEAVFKGLHKVVGKGRISRFLNDLAKPHVLVEDLEKAYAIMAEDEQEAKEALEWSEAVIGDINDETQ